MQSPGISTENSHSLYAPIQVAHWGQYNQANPNQVMQHHAISTAGSHCELAVIQIAHWDSYNKASSDKVVQHCGTSTESRSLLSFTLLIGLTTIGKLMQHQGTSTESSNLRVCCHSPCSLGSYGKLVQV